MKIAANNRDTNLHNLRCWMEENGKELSHSSAVSIAKEFAEYQVRLRYPHNDPYSNRTLKLTKYKLEQALKAVSTVGFIDKVPTSIGYLYAISNPQFTGWVKLGASKDAEARLLNYQTCSPHRDYVLECFIVVPDYFKEEESLLNRFADRKGEWVRCTNISDIKEVFKDLRKRSLNNIMGL